MAIRNAVWVCLADAQKARLLRCGVMPTARCHVDEKGAIEPVWEGHEHARPSPRSGKTGNTYASEGHEAHEELNRFARQIMNWLKDEAASRGIDQFVLFAPPRFLGVMRSIRVAHTYARIAKREGDLVNLDTAALSRHPAIHELVGLPG